MTFEQWRQLSPGDAAREVHQRVRTRLSPDQQRAALALTLPPERLILIYDELALDWGSLRIRLKGSAGGHNGVTSIIRGVGNENFIRVRLGIRPGGPVKEMKDYVLSKIRKAQMETLESTLEHALQAVETIITEGVEKAMTIHNRRAQGANEEQ